MRLRALAAVLAVSACAGGTVIYGTDFDAAFRQPGAVTLGGERPLAVAGVPPGGVTAEAVAGMLEVPGWVQPTRFRLAGPEEGRNQFSFALAFGTDRTVGLCAAPAGGADPALVGMALCLDGREISRASLRRAPGGDLAADLRALTRALLPRPRAEADGCFRPRGC